ncbi:hypothetical protein F7725_015017 [Dissostichus mawsoni]|uniref:Uncharacterized protein n=1 Tax=Dissostichus mawsoni TaxID=36200 RepID=A0A7J5YGK4_DISMA|nr:hypothetical protein F7725_015017 [Dissostichus mawsoni]
MNVSLFISPFFLHAPLMYLKGGRNPLFFGDQLRGTPPPPSLLPPLFLGGRKLLLLPRSCIKCQHQHLLESADDGGFPPPLTPPCREAELHPRKQEPVPIETAIPLADRWVAMGSWEGNSC